MAYVIYEGSTIRIRTTKPFTAIDGTIVDPDQVIFEYSVQNATPTQFVYTHGTGDPTGTIVRVSTGIYYADFDTTDKAGDWTYAIAGRATALHADPTRTQVRIEGTVTVSASSFE